MNMGDGISVEASQFSRRSIDFQLASVFKTPGRQNEYLNRTALSLFSRVSQAKGFSTVDLVELDFLNGLYEQLHSEDLLRELIDALNGMRRAYG
jgi:hypothetical protein